MIDYQIKAKCRWTIVLADSIMLMYTLLVDTKTYIYSKVSMDSIVVMGIMEPLNKSDDERPSFKRDIC